MIRVQRGEEERWFILRYRKKTVWSFANITSIPSGTARLLMSLSLGSTKNKTLQETMNERTTVF